MAKEGGGMVAHANWHEDPRPQRDRLEGAAVLAHRDLVPGSAREVVERSFRQHLAGTLLVVEQIDRFEHLVWGVAARVISSSSARCDRMRQSPHQSASDHTGGP